MLVLKRHWVRLLFRVHQIKLLAGSPGAVFRGYSAHLEPGGKVYDRHLKQEIEEYCRVHVESDEATNVPNIPLIEPAPASWLDMQGRAATRIRTATGDDMYGHVLSRLRAREGVRMLSLGSGPGGLELQFAREARSAKIVCIDLNAGLLEKGCAQAASEGLDVEFRQGDLNTILLPPENFDLVFCHASLHHLLELEHIFQQIKRTLKPRGELIVIDVITRHGYRMWPETRKVIDKIWKTLPAAYRVNHTSYHVKMIDEKIVDADSRRSNMECIRSEDILPLLEAGFETSAYVPYYSLCRRLFDTMYGPNYDLDRALDQAILDWLWALDCYYLGTGILRPETFFGIYRPKR